MNVNILSYNLIQQKIENYNKKSTITMEINLPKSMLAKDEIKLFNVQQIF